MKIWMPHSTVAEIVAISTKGANHECSYDFADQPPSLSPLASRELLAAVMLLHPEKLSLDRSTSFKTIPQTLVHIYQADQVWFSRISGYAVSLAQVNRDADLQGLGARWGDLLDGYVMWAEALKPDEWSSLIQYKTSQGKDFSNPLWQIVLHVVNHGTAHRAQVVSMLRQSDVLPPNLDLINYYRAEDPVR